MPQKAVPAQVTWAAACSRHQRRVRCAQSQHGYGFSQYAHLEVSAFAHDVTEQARARQRL